MERIINMPNENNKLYLYEALEMRGEYAGKMTTLRGLLPENVIRYNEDITPVIGLDVKEIRQKISAIEFKQIKLNNAIQKANFELSIEANGEKMTILEALALRKSLSDKVGRLSGMVKSSGYKKIQHMEERDIIKEPDLDFLPTLSEYEEEVVKFRNLNRAIRQASLTAVIDFRDE